MINPRGVGAEFEHPAQPPAGKKRRTESVLALIEHLSCAPSGIIPDGRLARPVAARCYQTVANPFLRGKLGPARSHRKRGN